MLKQIKLLYKELVGTGLVQSIKKTPPMFFDEPRRFAYTALIDNSSPYLTKLGYIIDGRPEPNSKNTTGKIYGTGVSFFSRKEALIKCLGEAVERLSLNCYYDHDLKQFSYIQNPKHALDPTVFIKNEQIKNTTFSWLECENLISKKKVFLPAQLIYLNYKRGKKEPRLSAPVSTGAAGGFNKTFAITKALYELIERDTFMTTYLLKIPGQRLEPKSIKQKRFRKTFEMVLRYKLQLHLIDITHDLGIPTFLTILIDKTGQGPAVSVGLKSDLNQLQAINGSIDEAFLTRFWIRTQTVKKPNLKIVPSEIETFLERGMYWYSQNRISLLDFYIRPPVKNFLKKTIINRLDQEYNILIKTLKNAGLDIFYLDISLKNFKKIGYFIYKVIIPGLQPLYLDEKRKYINNRRLKRVADYYKKEKYTINKIPHPFL